MFCAETFSQSLESDGCATFSNIRFNVGSRRTAVLLQFAVEVTYLRRNQEESGT